MGKQSKQPKRRKIGELDWRSLLNEPNDCELLQVREIFEEQIDADPPD